MSVLLLFALGCAAIIGGMTVALLIWEAGEGVMRRLDARAGRRIGRQRDDHAA